MCNFKAAAFADLSLDAMCVLYPGAMRYEIGERMTAVPAAEFFEPSSLLGD